MLRWVRICLLLLLLLHGRRITYILFTIDVNVVLRFYCVKVSKRYL